MLADPSLTYMEKQTYANVLKNALEKELGYSLADNIKTISTDAKGQGGNDIMGYITTENNTIYSNDKNQGTTEDIIFTIGQELAGAIQKAQGIDIIENRDVHNEYQDAIARDTVDDLSFVIDTFVANEINNYDADTIMSTTNKHVDSQSLHESTEIENNNMEFALLNKELGDNAIYLFGDQVVATDGVNDHKIIDLTAKEVIELGVLENAFYMNDSIDIGSVFFPGLNILSNISPSNTASKESVFYNGVAVIEPQDYSSFAHVYNLDNQSDFNSLRVTTDMNYDNVNANTDIVFENGMGNTEIGARESQDMIQADFPNQNVGLINNVTGKYSYASDYLEWKPNYLTTKDALNAYMLQKLSPDTIVITHSAGNEDIFKANQVNALVGANTPYIHYSVGSPTSATKLEISDNAVGATLKTQINHPNDPVTIVNEEANYEVEGLLPFNDLGDYHPFTVYYKNKIKEIIQIQNYKSQLGNKEASDE